MINVIHSVPTSEGNVFANIKSVSPLPKSMVCPPPIVEPYLFDYEENFKPEFVLAMSQKTGLFKKITRSEEWLAKGIAIPDADSELKKF